MSYEDPTIQECIPLVNPNIWHVKVPLVVYTTIEMHKPDRVLRQFGIWEPIVRMTESIWTSDSDKLNLEKECSPQLAEDLVGMQDACRDSSHEGARVGLAETRSHEGTRVNLPGTRLRAMSTRRPRPS
ncbi:hypothetical protein GOBAR_AA29796 [Gossypium barbadense]|uniref:Uncharacterized protein n=1 Tax=Gossypium barbadense TaxID=3634 RepID=A0A2P5WII9_GOSBA|nr:hypothetical protein GOBAR_AA29796 [Gossypium barbadense]